MKTTTKSRLLKAGSGHKVRPVMLVQEKLARARLLQQLILSRRPLLDAINTVLAPLTRNGHGAVYNVTLTEQDSPLQPESYHAWFVCRYQQKTLGWWRIDSCTLDQLASCYYGSLATPLSSPLREPSQSEFRLVKNLLLQALSALPMGKIDPEQVELELVKPPMSLDAPAVWSIDLGKERCVAPMLFCMAEHLLGLMSEQPKESVANKDLAKKLELWLQQLPIKLQMTLGQHAMPVRSLNQLNVGDILPMNLNPKGQLNVGNRPLFQASVHSHEGQMVAKLTQDIFQHEDSNIG
ncbi:FliM/FliN family flagellar motor switch protein [Shewanella algidipiscicola]|uniref:Flagellar motor switch protein FliN-like C-terminal domain-containing protein n=1 Tax=Shewanella algidipiscicola TaxID=614070 RepID=A0ABQ4P1S1_9GAMM|nr:FliM/FliN family flagellar motor switch protein [Shewanella algidipiscicola]GIU41455.1 hypothetical protein TUM4630_00080 [Shewanella algidipiscicola]